MTALQKIIGSTLSLLTGVMYFIVSPPAVCLESRTDITSLSQLESKLFFKTYANDNLTSRLERIERQVFGEPITESIDTRLMRLCALSSIRPDLATRNTAPNTGVYNEPPTLPRFDGQHIDESPSNLDKEACEAERAKVTVMAAKEEEIKELLASGVELWRHHHRQEALEKFEQVSRLDPTNAEAHYSKGIIEESSGNIAEALASYRLALKARPGNKEYLSAVEAANKKLAVKKDTKQAELHHLTQSALIAYKRGEYLSALDLYKTLDRKTPNQHLVKYNIGTIYLMLKVPEKALEHYKQAHKLNPSESKYIEASQRLEQIIVKDTSR